MNKFFGLFDDPEMDSRLRGNDIGITRHISVIPAKAGIHDDTAWKFKESIHIYLNIGVKNG